MTDHGAFIVISIALKKTSHAPSVLELGNLWDGVPVKEMNEIWLSRRVDDCPFRNLQVLRLSLTLGIGWTGSSRKGAENGPKYRSQVEEFVSTFCEVLLDADCLHTFGLTIINRNFEDRCITGEVFSGILNFAHGSDLPDKLSPGSLGSCHQRIRALCLLMLKEENP